MHMKVQLSTVREKWLPPCEPSSTEDYTYNIYYFLVQMLELDSSCKAPLNS